MSGLVLKLAPRERVLVNGAVVENGERRGRLVIKSPGAKILRLKDAIHPDEATTPVRRACYATQLVLSGDQDSDEMHTPLLERIEELSQVFTDVDSRSCLAVATQALVSGQHYRCLKALRSLLPREERLFAAHSAGA